MKQKPDLRVCPFYQYGMGRSRFRKQPTRFTLHLQKFWMESKDVYLKLTRTYGPTAAFRALYKFKKFFRNAN